MKKILVLFAVLSVILSSGCVSRDINQNLANAQKLRCGMSKEQVLAVMGEPLKNQKLADDNNWYYRDQICSFDWQDTADECMILVFENDKLIGWGRDFNTRRKFTSPVD
ncbi:MAG: DUF3192 domain-containing protein [Lentisphaeria bacterium]|nr:DUF3192 domain-containing protein [Lentisphaeria bacterium]